MATVVGPAAGQLVGREGEGARLEAVVDAARAGSGAAVLLTGAPGTGRTALLEHVPTTGLRVIALAGAEAEPDGIPAGLAAALGRAEDPADRPLLVRADDLQWLGGAAQAAVAGLARRAGELGIGVLATWELPAPPPPAWAGVEELELPELDAADALALAAAGGLAPTPARALVAAVGGTPLALTEAARRLPAEVRDGRRPLPTALPLGRRLERAHAARLAALGTPAADALLLAAVSTDGGVGPLEAALGGLAPLLLAEEAGVLRLDGARVAFTRPVDRALTLALAGPASRRAAHRALAAATTGATSAWHLATAAEAPDEELAAALEAAAYAAAPPVAAADVLERAAALTPDPSTAIRRTVGAAAAALAAGDPDRAGGLLDPVLPRATDPLLRADVQLLRGMAMQQRGRPMAAFGLLEATADEVLPHDRARAAGLLTQAGVALVAHGPMDRLAALAERALALAPPGGEIVPAVFHASALASLGEHTRAREELRRHHAALREVDPTGPGHEILAVAALCHLWMEDLDDCERLLTWLVGTGRERGAVAALAFPLAVLASLNLRLGAFADAAALSAEALALGEGATGQFPHSVTLTTAAFVAAHVGDDEACAAHAEAARALGLRLGLTSTLACAERALGFLALGHGDAAAALGHLERAHEHEERFGSRDPSFLYTHADLVEARVRTGRLDAAAALTDELAAMAERTGGAWAAAATARCRALTRPDAELDAHVAAALAAHARLELPFERARTQLAVGERLRRARRRTDARGLLAAAHATFAALGAGHWAHRAEQELRAAGVLPPGDDAPAVPLTSREREVCDLVAAGATNREVAAALYLSPRTVEHHLRMTYRKLGLRSRAELCARWRPA